MAKLSDRALTDLSKLAADRSQRAVESVLQLVGGDDEAYVVIIACAANMLEGAASYLAKDGEHTTIECRAAALGHIDRIFKMNLARAAKK